MYSMNNISRMSEIAYLEFEINYVRRVKYIVVNSAGTFTA